MESDFLKSDVGRDLLKAPWEDHLHLVLPFESLDGYYTEVSGSGGNSVSGQQVQIYTGTTSGSMSRVLKYPWGFPRVSGWNPPPLFDHHLTFQASVTVNNDTNQEIEHVWGEAAGKTSQKVGMYVSNSTLYVRTCDGAAINDVSVTTFTAPLNATIIGEFFPDDKFELRVLDLDTGDEYSGVSTSNLPSGTAQANRIFQAWITNTAAEMKRYYVTLHEVWIPRTF